jgi:branched-chain amino acid transport system permease protein
MPFASGYFRTSYARDLRLVDTRTQITGIVALVAIVAAFPFFAGPFLLDLANQFFLAVVGAVALMLLTGVAGLVSLGHAGLLAAGAFTAGILYKEVGAPIWVTVPAAAVTGAILGIVFGLPSLRLRGLYLAVSTLALHFVVVYAGHEYETKRGFSTGILIDPPIIAGFVLDDARVWYGVLLAAAVTSVLVALNLLRAKTGRAWRAIHDHETVAAGLGINVPLYKLAAFVVSSTMTAVAGALFAYYRGFVSVEAFSLFLSIQYVAMVIIGGMGSILGAVLGAAFVTLFPYLIEASMGALPNADRYSSLIYAVNYAAFGLVMVLFLVFEPLGLVGIWRRIRDWIVLWPYKQRPLRSTK